MGKPTYVKPSFYAHCFLPLKEKAKEYGYNLVLHGSMNRDFDLIALPWDNYLKKPEELILAFAEIVGGTVMDQTEEQINCFPHGRKSYVINLNRGGKDNGYVDEEWYLDISLFPGQPQCVMCNKNIDHGEQVCLDCFGITEELTDTEELELKPGDKVKFLFPGYDNEGKNEDWEFEDEVVFERGKLRFKAYSNDSIEYLEEEGLIWDLKKIIN